ncbi:hypothetical protein ABIE28_001675 [Devosia sp. 2618]
MLKMSRMRLWCRKDVAQLVLNRSINSKPACRFWRPSGTFIHFEHRLISVPKVKVNDRRPVTAPASLENTAGSLNFCQPTQITFDEKSASAFKRYSDPRRIAVFKLNVGVEFSPLTIIIDLCVSKATVTEEHTETNTTINAHLGHVTANKSAIIETTTGNVDAREITAFQLDVVECNAAEGQLPLRIRELAKLCNVPSSQLSEDIKCNCNVVWCFRGCLFTKRLRAKVIVCLASIPQSLNGRENGGGSFGSKSCEKFQGRRTVCVRVFHGHSAQKEYASQPCRLAVTSQQICSFLVPGGNLCLLRVLDRPNSVGEAFSCNQRVKAEKTHCQYRNSKREDADFTHQGVGGQRPPIKRGCNNHGGNYRTCYKAQHEVGHFHKKSPEHTSLSLALVAGTTILPPYRVAP